jgi:hypothetical protein
MAAVLLLPTGPTEYVTGWVDFPPLADAAAVDPHRYKFEDLQLLTKAVSSSKPGFHLELQEADDGEFLWFCV